MVDRIPNIGPVVGLNPKKAHFLEAPGETFVNMDGVIAIMQQIDTPQAKKMNRAFRRRHAEMRLAEPGEAPDKLRQRAMLKALEDCGHKVNLTKVGPAND